MSGLQEEVEALYSLAPGDFIAARDARFRELRGTDRPLADAVKALRRPSVAAWAVNQLVRSQRDLIDQVLELGVALRQAQASLQGDSLRELGRQRRQLVASVAHQARAGVDQRLSDAVMRQIEDTLTAAMVDEEAAVAVSSGALTESLASTGLGSLGMAQVVALPRLRAVPDLSPEPDPDPTDRLLAELERASSLLADAEARLAKATAKRDKRAAVVLQAESELEELRRRMAQIEHDLTGAAERLEAAEEGVAAAQELRDEAKVEAVAAAKAVAGR